MTRNAWILAAFVVAVVLALLGRADLVPHVLDAVPDEAPAEPAPPPALPAPVDPPPEAQPVEASA